MTRRQQLIYAGVRGAAPGGGGRWRALTYGESQVLAKSLAVTGVALPPPPPPPAPPAPGVQPAAPVDERQVLLQQLYPESFRERSMR